MNDSLGHGEGDRLLKRVATTLVECLRPLDTAARMGGDEFAVLIEDVQSRDDITLLAGRIVESLRPPVRLGSKTVSAAGSIGIAFDVEGITSEQLLRNADIAMYKAKELRQEPLRGLSRRDARPGPGPDRAGGRIAGGDLRRRPHHPLPADPRPAERPDRRVRGPGALAAPPGGLVDPRLFVSIAEEMGIISEIDSFVLRTACGQARRWQESNPDGPALVMSVNLSAGQLVEPGLSRRIAADVAESGFAPSSLVIEITESEMLTDNEATVLNLAELRSLGVRIALDDFGTGFSSLSHLDRLQVDIVKIDKSFVQALGTPDDSRSMTAAMVQLARTLGYETIAEGVESRKQEASLRALGCSLAQGYQLGRPRDADATEELLASLGMLPQRQEPLAR